MTIRSEINIENRDAAYDAATALVDLRNLLARFADALPMADEPGDEQDQRYGDVMAMWETVDRTCVEVRKLAHRLQYGM
jgi:hypothetical protein